MSNNIRIEEDLLGTREVPADAYYGVHTLRAIENFYISNNKISDIPEFVRGMVMVKKAAAMANKELQTIPKSVANAIIAACDEVLNHASRALWMLKPSAHICAIANRERHLQWERRRKIACNVKMYWEKP